jgi:hypothetical protein
MLLKNKILLFFITIYLCPAFMQDTDNVQIYK